MRNKGMNIEDAVHWSRPLHQTEHYNINRKGYEFKRKNLLKKPKGANRTLHVLEKMLNKRGVILHEEDCFTRI